LNYGEEIRVVMIYRNAAN
jgi:hypothetical protein